MTSSGEFGRGGDRRVHAHLQLRGRFEEVYLSFLVEKARLLSLPLTITSEPATVTAELTGPEALLGAFEMSAIIGTQGCSVEQWDWVSWRHV